MVFYFVSYFNYRFIKIVKLHSNLQNEQTHLLHIFQAGVLFKKNHFLFQNTFLYNLVVETIKKNISQFQSTISQLISLSKEHSKLTEELNQNKYNELNMYHKIDNISLKKKLKNLLENIEILQNNIIDILFPLIVDQVEKYVLSNDKSIIEAIFHKIMEKKNNLLDSIGNCNRKEILYSAMEVVLAYRFFERFCFCRTHLKTQILNNTEQKTTLKSLIHALFFNTHRARVTYYSVISNKTSQLLPYYHKQTVLIDNLLLFILQNDCVGILDKPVNEPSSDAKSQDITRESILCRVVVNFMHSSVAALLTVNKNNISPQEAYSGQSVPAHCLNYPRKLVNFIEILMENKIIHNNPFNTLNKSKLAHEVYENLKQHSNMSIFFENKEHFYKQMIKKYEK